MTYETILLEQREPGIWLLTINRPKSLNALAPQVLDDIAAATRAVASDPGARCLAITGAGDKAFVAGARHRRDERDVAAARDASSR